MKCKQCGYSLWNLSTRKCPECGTYFKPSDYDLIPNSVRFCCPRCDQHYFGTSERGHLVPSSFNCVSCTQPIEMDQMVIRPVGNVDTGEVEKRTDTGSAGSNWAVIQADHLDSTLPTTVLVGTTDGRGVTISMSDWPFALKEENAIRVAHGLLPIADPFMSLEEEPLEDWPDDAAVPAEESGGTGAPSNPEPDTQTQAQPETTPPGAL
jgi:hypothetical protein